MSQIMQIPEQDSYISGIIAVECRKICKSLMQHTHNHAHVIFTRIMRTEILCFLIDTVANNFVDAVGMNFTEYVFNVIVRKNKCIVGQLIQARNQRKGYLLIGGPDRITYNGYCFFI